MSSYIGLSLQGISLSLPFAWATGAPLGKTTVDAPVAGAFAMMPASHFMIGSPGDAVAPLPNTANLISGQWPTRVMLAEGRNVPPADRSDGDGASGPAAPPAGGGDASEKRRVKEMRDLADRWEWAYEKATTWVTRLRATKSYWKLIDRAVEAGISRGQFEVYRLLEEAERRLKDLESLKGGLEGRDPAALESETEEMYQLENKFSRIYGAKRNLSVYVIVLLYSNIQALIDKVSAYAPVEVLRALQQIYLDYADDLQSIVEQVKTHIGEATPPENFKAITKEARDLFRTLFGLLELTEDVKPLDSKNLDEILESLKTRKIDDYRKYLVRRMEDGRTIVLLFGLTHIAMLHMLALRYSKGIGITLVETNKADRAGGFIHWAEGGKFRIDSGSDGVPSNMPTALALWNEALTQLGYPLDKMIER